MNKKQMSAAITGVVTSGLVMAQTAAAAPVPNPKPQLPGDISSKLSTALGMFMAIVIVGCVAGVFMAAWKMAVAYRNHELGEAAGKLGAVAAACVLVGSASAIVTFLYA